MCAPNRRFSLPGGASLAHGDHRHSDGTLSLSLTFPKDYNHFRRTTIPTIRPPPPADSLNSSCFRERISTAAGRGATQSTRLSAWPGTLLYVRRTLALEGALPLTPVCCFLETSNRGRGRPNAFITPTCMQPSAEYPNITLPPPQGISSVVLERACN